MTCIRIVVVHPLILLFPNTTTQYSLHWSSKQEIGTSIFAPLPCVNGSNKTKLTLSYGHDLFHRNGKRMYCLPWIIQLCCRYQYRPLRIVAIFWESKIAINRKLLLTDTHCNKMPQKHDYTFLGKSIFIKNRHNYGPIINDCCTITV